MNSNFYVRFLCLTLILSCFSPLYAVKWASYSSGMGLTLDHWEGEDPLEWNRKRSYPLAAKNLLNLKLASTLKWKPWLLTDIEVPLFYNKVLEYKTTDQYNNDNNDYTADAFALGFGDINISARVHQEKSFFKIQIAIPGLYDPETDIQGAQPLENNEEEDETPRIKKLGSWTGMGAYRLGLTWGLKGDYSQGPGNWYVYTGIDLVLGDRADFNWMLNRLPLVDLKQSDAYGNGLVEPYNTKIKVGGIHSKPLSEKLMLKTGLNVSHSRYHWYGKDIAPRSELSVEPFLGHQINLQRGRFLSLNAGFTAYKKVWDKELPVAGKKLFMSVSFSHYF